MSIVLRTNQLNALIYKYFLEAGLTHSAFSLFNEANLTSSFQQFKFDIKAGHLLTLLEKGLILSQIESHVNFNEYQECAEPFFLVKAHTCKISEKVKIEREKTLLELTSHINESMRRTNAIYHTELANRQYDEIVYDAKGNSYFDKFLKFRLHSQVGSQCTLTGQGNNIAIHNEYTLILLKPVNETVLIDMLLPTVNRGRLDHMTTFNLNDLFILQIYLDNYITLLKREDLQLTEFLPGLKETIVWTEFNPVLPHILMLSSAQECELINLSSMRRIARQDGRCIWRTFDEYIVMASGTLKLKSMRDGTILEYVTEGIDFNTLLLSTNRNFFSVSNSDRIHVYTFEKVEPLYIFEEAMIKEVLWVNSKQVEYLVYLGEKEIKVWEIELNSYSKIIECSQYDRDIKKIYALQKENGEAYLLGLGAEHILIYDLSYAKIERIEIDGAIQQIKPFGETIAVLTDLALYFIKATMIDPLFR